jgi:hypothetical protein
MAGDYVEGVLNIGNRLVPADILYSEVSEKEEGRIMRRMSSSVVADHFLPGRSVKWEITNLFRLVEGVLVIFCEFITIIQSEVALDLWMNFAAVAFVGELDDMGFKLAQHQLIDDTAKRVTDRVGRVKVHKKKATTGIHRFIRRFTRFLMFFGLAAVLWIGLAVVQSYQDGQKFTCKNVYLSVEESEGVPWARYYSGLYEIIANSKFAGMAEYSKFDDENYTIYYDNELNRWIISDDENDFELVSSLLTARYYLFILTIFFLT